VSLLLLSACKKTAAPPPTFLVYERPAIVIEGDTLLADGEIDAWVYPGGRFLAVVEEAQRLPLTVPAPNPILTAGGIRINGITLTRKPYPFWQYDTLKHDFAPEEVLIHRPIYTYLPDTLINFFQKEDFETPQLSFRFPNAGDPLAASLRRTYHAPRRGFWCGEIAMAPNQIFQAETTPSFEFPNSEVWLEISVRGDRNLGIGLTRENKQTGALVSRDVYLLLRPPDEGWKTFYVDLTPWMREGSGLYRFRVYLTSMADSAQSSTLYIDDVRILSFRP